MSSKGVRQVCREVFLDFGLAVVILGLLPVPFLVAVVHRDALPAVIKAHWVEYGLVPFVSLPFLLACVKMFAKRRTLPPEREDFAVGFDLVLAVAASAVCLWATVSAPGGGHAAEGTGDAPMAAAFVQLLQSLIGPTLVVAVGVKLFGWEELRPLYNPREPQHTHQYRAINDFGVVLPLLLASAFILWFCSVLGTRP
jgi:hypothetical protein